jgi:cytochrome c5
MALILAFSVFVACDDKRTTKTEESVSAHELFESKCTQCHEGSRAMELHGSEETILQLVKRMRAKGAKVSEVQAMSIAKFLSSPNRPLFDARCSSCHDLQIVLDAHKKGDLTEATLKSMQEKGAKISDSEAKEIFDFIKRSYPRAD